MDTLVRAIAISHSFGRHAALSEVDLSLARGEVLGLLGPNGAGKTTCLRLLAGLLVPTAGRVELLGLDLARRPVAARRHLGYLPERPPLHPELRVDEYLRFCARLRGIPCRRVPAALDEAKRRCGLADSGRLLIATLSKGYRQRLGLAQAIIHRPPLLILDEPTEGLDPAQMRELRALIRGLAADSGVILSTHLLPEAQAVCDRVAILHQGRIRHDAPLNQDPLARAWQVRLGDAEALATLEHLPCVTDAVPIDDTARDPNPDGGVRYRVRLRRVATSADLARGIVEAGLPLFEMSPERSSLERTFFDITGVAETAP